MITIILFSLLSTGPSLTVDPKLTKSVHKKRVKSKSDRHVHFTADALILNAALEGELELLKECTRKVRIIAQPSYT